MHTPERRVSRRSRTRLSACILIVLAAGCGARTELHGQGGAGGPTADGGALFDGIAPPPGDGSATCDSSKDEVFVDGTCQVLPAPRLLAPLSTAITTSQRPTLHWVLAGNTTGTHLEICSDRLCNTVVTSFDADGTSGAPTSDVTAGTYFWRAFGRKDGVTGLVPSLTWELRVGHLSAKVDTSWGSFSDVDADGHADLLVDQREIGTGAPGTAGPGHLFVHKGGANGISATPTTTIAGPNGSGALFGEAIGLGDFDGDGFVDVFVGAPGATTHGGSADVYKGGPSGLSTSPAVTISGPSGGYFGAAISSAGDVNGDGYADAIVGAKFVKGGNWNFSGAAYLFLGGPSGLASSPTLTLNQPDDGTDFGFAVESIGDVNGDGYADVAITENKATPAPTGGVYMIPHLYVYLGSATGLPTAPTYSLDGPPHNYNASDMITLAGPCDVNGDGYADLVAGSLGRFIVYFGGASGLDTGSSASFIIPGETEYDYSFKITCGGDLNGDGYDDVVTSYDSLYVYLGSPWGPPVSPSLIVTPPDGDVGIYGYQTGSLGDVDGDGRADLAVGAPNYLNWVGRAYLFPGTLGGIALSPAATLTGSGNSGAQYGCALQ